uniref:Uncharacterized protein n=1 Tax=Solanum lycopersicum TaxID=4081 RepID=A0A3Q7FAF7_SOLLC
MLLRQSNCAIAAGGGCGCSRKDLLLVFIVYLMNQFPDNKFILCIYSSSWI